MTARKHLWATFDLIDVRCSYEITFELIRRAWSDGESDARCEGARIGRTWNLQRRGKTMTNPEQSDPEKPTGRANGLADRPRGPVHAWPIGVVYGLATVVARLHDRPVQHAGQRRLLAPNSHYRNIRPSVKYVGDEACTRCHAEIAQAYRNHPMGRSLDDVKLATFPGTNSLSFQAQGLEYAVERRGDRVFHKEICAQYFDAPLPRTLRAGCRWVHGSSDR